MTDPPVTHGGDSASSVARAEFRVFGRGVIDVVKTRIWEAHAILQGIRKMPPEIYFLAAGNEVANVKVRDGLLDIKVKTGETPEGYEIFQPRGKFQFPVRREELATIVSHLKADVAIDGDSCTIDEFVAIARRHPVLVPVTVEKMRYGFSIDGVICEYAQVWFNGAMVESACVESENYEAMRNVVEMLGLSTEPNTNYLRAAKRVVGID